jgi:apolipoprotein D and lipocalin family protein
MKSKIKYISIAILFAGLGLASCSSVPVQEDPPLQVAAHVDKKKYLGKWYEIARYPHSFEENCYAVTADYKLLENGSIQVTNRCREGSLEGELKEAVGTAYFVDSQTNAKLEVTFFWPFYGDYWIIDLDENYQYAVVSEPKRQYLWILSRTSTMNASLYDQLTAKLKKNGFDLSLLTKTPQNSPKS